MNTRSVSRPTTSASSTSTCGSAAARRLSTSACKLLIHPSFRQQKSGRAPAFYPAPANRRPNESCEAEDSTVDLGGAVEEALAFRSVPRRSRGARGQPRRGKVSSGRGALPRVESAFCSHYGSKMHTRCREEDRPRNTREILPSRFLGQSLQLLISRPARRSLTRARIRAGRPQSAHPAATNSARAERRDYAAARRREWSRYWR